jgi:Flp pilus assembly pilin Flp
MTSTQELTGWSGALRNFHQDEDGLEAIQVVLIIAIAAVVLIALKVFWGYIKDWVNTVFHNLSNTSDAEGWKKPS